MEPLTLQCWVYGEPIFFVKISKTETVASLKNAIKSEAPGTFYDVDAHTLALYKVFLPDATDAQLEESLKNLSLDKQERLGARTKLFKVFPEPTPADGDDETTVVVVDVATLNCWVRGQATNNVFEVKISRTVNVTALKEAIKSKAQMDFPAHALALYKPRDPVLSPYNENLSSVILSEHGQLLRPSDVLSQVLPAPSPAGHIHVIVDAPYLMIVCWLRGNTLDSRFPISIPANGSISQLKHRIKELHPKLRDVSDLKIHLFRVSGDDDELQECLSKTGDGGPLQGDTLGPNFLGVPVLDPLRIIAEVTSSTRSTNPFPLLHQGFGGVDPIAAARKTFADGRKPRAPSDASHPSAFHKTQQDKNTQIPCGRPREPEELIPVTLLHPVFGQFVDDCQIGTMTEGDNQFIGKLANVMSNLYLDEAQRVRAVDEVFKSVHLNFNILQNIPATNYVMDASLSAGGPDLPPYCIAELKNEAANNNSEPYIQAVAYYLEATRKYAPNLSKCALPCFLLVAFGPYIVFAGAVWNLRPVVQVLSTPLALHYHSTDTQNQLTVARCMAAFRKALKTLKTYYEGLSGDKAGLVNKNESHDTLFPCYTEFKSLEDESTQTICYAKQFDEGGNKKGLVFFGTLEGDPTVLICIKFSRRYSKEAHLHCAELGFAPKLRGFEELPGGWYMVVMDRLVDYDVLADLADTDSLPKSGLETMGEQLKTLHARHLVHGDIRDTNILVKKDKRTQLMLIDFEWAGVEDIVRYPPYVNYTDIERPNDARDGLPIKAVHDLAMLERITRVWAEK